MNLFERYNNFLEKFSKSLVNGTFKDYVKNNFIKLLLIYMSIQLAAVCLNVYLRGYCVTCDKITQSQFDQMIKDGTFSDWTNEQIYVKYPNFKTFLVDVGGGFLVTCIYTFTILIILYTMYKLLQFLVKNITNVKT